MDFAEITGRLWAIGTSMPWVLLTGPIGLVAAIWLLSAFMKQLKRATGNDWLNQPDGKD